MGATPIISKNISPDRAEYPDRHQKINHSKLVAKIMFRQLWVGGYIVRFCMANNFSSVIHNIARDVLVRR